MTDLRAVKCLTEDEREHLRTIVNDETSEDGFEISRRNGNSLLDTLDVAVAIIRGEYTPTDEQKRALGIFGE